MAKRTPRPGRTLLIFFIVIGVFYGLAALGDSWKPRLGLDLEGGTRITLSATEQGGQKITQTKLKQAANIVDRRVNGSGVSEAEVSTQGNRNIIVEIPGKNASSLVDSVKRTAQLRFRIVAGSPQPGTPAAQSPSPSPSSSAEPLGCRQPQGQPEGHADAEGGQVLGHPQPPAGPVREDHTHPVTEGRHRDPGRLTQCHAQPGRAERVAAGHPEGRPDRRPGRLGPEPR